MRNLLNESNYEERSICLSKFLGTRESIVMDATAIGKFINCLALFVSKYSLVSKCTQCRHAASETWKQTNTTVLKNDVSISFYKIIVESQAHTKERLKTFRKIVIIICLKVQYTFRESIIEFLRLDSVSDLWLNNHGIWCSVTDCD